MKSDKHSICVDLDGTLIKTDSLFEMFVKLIKHNFFYLFLLPFWLIKGIPFLKQKLTSLSGKYIISLPFNEPLIDFLKKEKSNGRKLYLVTACDENLARQIAKPLNLFDEIIGTKNGINLKASNKANYLAKKFGNENFIYAGNDTPDFKVWEKCSDIIVVSPSKTFINKVRQKFPHKNITEFSYEGFSIKSFLRLIRVHQWSKNLLIFVPLFLSHKYGDLTKCIDCLSGFFAFCLCASATYILNDLLDLDADRQNPLKKKRPTASGAISISTAFATMFIFFGLATLFAVIIKIELLLLLAIYTIITLAYSFYLKRIVLLDVLILAILYMYRLEFGAISASVPISFWLATFSIFFFLSLGFLKRFVELRSMPEGNNLVTGRGYVKNDTSIVTTLGIASGFVSLLVYLIYIQDSAMQFYKNPEFLMYGVLVLIYFLCNIWFDANRGNVQSDPIVYAMKSKTSYILGSIFVLLFIFANPIA